MLLNSLVTASSLAFAAVAAASPKLFRRADNRPTVDPFYTQPDNIATYNAGDIIRSRNTPSSIGAPLRINSVNLNASYQLLYRTQDALGNPTAAVATILIPHNAHYDKVLAYQAAYDSSDPNCSPSFSLQQQSNSTGYDTLFMGAALDRGWIVTTADYEGLGAHFVAGLVAGYATLDSVRATLSSQSVTGVLPNATYSLWGYSGGALACEWALELQPLYAPDLSFAGAALGGLTPNVSTVLYQSNKTPFVFLAFAGINGIAGAYPNLTAYVNQKLLPAKAAEFHSINYACSNASSAELTLAGQDISDYFAGGYAALQEPLPQSVVTWGATMGKRSIPTVPIHAYKAIGDEISPVQDTDELVDHYCANGATIQYTRNTVGEHVTEAILGSASAFGYLIDRMSGVPVASGCQVSNVTVSALDLDAFDGFSTEVVAVLKVLLGLPVGPLSIKGL